MDATDFQKRAAPLVLSHKNYNKLFCIGYNKTGTTTMAAILKRYGLKLPSQSEQEIRLTRQTFATNYAPLKDFVAKFDAFQDLPFSQGEVYAVCDALFPDSKFILTERDSEKWFNSLCRFHQKVFKISDLGGGNAR